MPRIENLEENKMKLYFEATGEQFEEGLQHSYHKNKGSIAMSGFRKGRAPRKLIEMTYGKEIFYDDAIDFVLPGAFQSAIKELDLERSIVSQPKFNADEISKETGVCFTAEFYVKPQVTITEYQGLTYKPYSCEATDAEIEAELEKVREQNSRILTVDRPIEESDIAVIDFEGFSDGVPFEGGKGEDYQLVIGSHTFIDNFEEQLIGKAVGDDIDVNVTFPEKYQAENLAGKEALFKVTIKEVKVKELPEVDDEFAQDVSEFDTLEEYKQDIAAKLQKAKEADSEKDKERQLSDKLIANAEMNVPEVMIDNEVDNAINELGRRLSYQGMDLQTYLHYAGQNMSTLRMMYRPEAERQTKTRLILEAIAKAEAIEISDDELDAEIREMADTYGMDFDKMKLSLREMELEDIKENLKIRAAYKIVGDSAQETPDEENQGGEQNNEAEHDAKEELA